MEWIWDCIGDKMPPEPIEFPEGSIEDIILRSIKTRFTQVIVDEINRMNAYFGTDLRAQVALYTSSEEIAYIASGLEQDALSLEEGIVTPAATLLEFYFN